MFFAELQDVRANHLMSCVLEMCERKEHCEITERSLDGNVKRILCHLYGCTISIVCLVGNSAEKLRHVIDDLRAAETPVFAFVDPYGFNIPMDFISSLLQLDTIDLFVNLMTSYMNRFRALSGYRNTFAQLLYRGEEQVPDVLPICAANLDGMRPDERWKRLGNIYCERLKESFPDISWCSIGVRDEGNQPKYHLILLTRHIEGLKVMKDSMWKCATDYAAITDSIVFREGRESEANSQRGVAGAALLLQRFGDGWRFVELVEMEYFILYETAVPWKLRFIKEALKEQKLLLCIDGERWLLRSQDATEPKTFLELCQVVQHRYQGSFDDALVDIIHGSLKKCGWGFPQGKQVLKEAKTNLFGRT